MFRRLALVCALVLGIVTPIVATGAVANAATPTSFTLPVSTFAHVVAGGPDNYVFVSGGGALVVRNADGTAKTTLTADSNAAGLALSADGSVLYVALPSSDAVSAISTSTLTEVGRYATGASTCPSSVTVLGTTVWFGYGCSAPNGAIGAIDLTQQPAAVHLAVASGFYYAPLLASSANASTRLFAGVPGLSPADLYAYDISGTTLTADGDVEVGSNLADLTVTANGADVITASGNPYYLMVHKSADLSGDGQFDSDDPYPDAVAASSGGAVAEGLASATPDVRTYRADGTLINTYSFGQTAGVGDSTSLAQAGLAFAATGSTLYAVTTDYLGNAVTLRVLAGATEPPSVLTVSAPKTSARAAALTVTGALSSGGVALAGKRLTVVKHDLAGNHSLAAVITGATGHFTIRDTPTIGGAVTYTVSYAGDATHPAASRAVTVTVSRATPSVSIAVNRHSFTYGQTATVTAHLGSTYTLRTLVIYATTYGGKAKAIKTGKVDSHGQLRVTYKMTIHTTFTAKFAGDYRDVPVSKAATATSSAHVNLVLVGYYKTVGSYRVFQAGTFAGIVADVAPNQAGGCVVFHPQVYSGGAWHDKAASGCDGVDVNEANDGFSATAGLKWRMRATFTGDAANTAASSSWRYLEF